MENETNSPQKLENPSTPQEYSEAEQDQDQEQLQENSQTNEDQIPNQEEYQETYTLQSSLNKKRYRNTNKKRYIETPSEDQIKEESQKFIGKLRECVEEDKHLQRENKPSLEKLKMLPKIRTFLANIYYQKEFLDQEGLEVLQNWLKRNRDGTYPPLNQISTILDVLFNLNRIEIEHLKSCSIGGYVMEISNNESLSKNIINKAKEIVKKWSRIVYRINVDYSKNEIENDDSKYREFKENTRKFYEDEDIEDKAEEEEEGEEDDEGKIKRKELKDVPLENLLEYEIYHSSKIPKKGLFDFSKKPISNINIEQRKSDDEMGVLTYLNSLKKKQKKNAKTSKKVYDYI